VLRGITSQAESASAAVSAVEGSPIGSGQSSKRGKILSAAGKGASAEEAAIVNSGWASSAYGGRLGGTVGGTRGAQASFARWFARLSGLSLATVEKWALSEQPPGSPATPGSNNWLNIQYTDSGPNATYYRIAKLPPRQAAEASLKWMRENGY
jgi:hypothetical protein